MTAFCMIILSSALFFHHWFCATLEPTGVLLHQLQISAISRWWFHAVESITEN